VPLSTINHTLDALTRTHDRIVVYNKADLANPNMQQVHRRTAPPSIEDAAHQHL